MEEKDKEISWEGFLELLEEQEYGFLRRKDNQLEFVNPLANEIVDFIWDFNSTFTPTILAGYMRQQLRIPELVLLVYLLFKEKFDLYFNPSTSDTPGWSDSWSELITGTVVAESLGLLERNSERVTQVTERGRAYLKMFEKYIQFSIDNRDFWDLEPNLRILYWLTVENPDPDLFSRQIAGANDDEELLLSLVCPPSFFRDPHPWTYVPAVNIIQHRIDQNDYPMK